jgi:hypothetical protein
MKIKTAIYTIIAFFLLPLSFVWAIDLPEQTEVVTVTGRITIDIYSTLSLNPVTVEINQPSTVTIRILSPGSQGIPGRTVVIYSPDLQIVQPTQATNSSGITTGSVYATSPGTYLVCAKDITFGYEINIANCKTLYVVPVGIPTFVPEPYYTKGTTNTVMWNNLGTGYQYYVEVSEDPNFETVIGRSGWTESTSHMFTNLENEKMYFYRVKARNVYGGEGDWSTPVFSVQDSEPPEIGVIQIGNVGENTTTEWDPDYQVDMMFKVTDNLQLEDVTFLCVDSEGNTYACVDSYEMEGDNLLVTLELRDLERVSGAYLRGTYEFCVEAVDAAGNISRNCDISFIVPTGDEVEPDRPPVIEIIETTLDDINEALDDTI